MYKVGDKVRVKRIQWYHAMKDCHGAILEDGMYFTKTMSIYCGKTFKIEQVLEVFGKMRYYLEGVNYSFGEWMFDEQPPLQHGEKVLVSDHLDIISVSDGVEAIFMRKNPTNFSCKLEFINRRVNFKYLIPLRVLNSIPVCEIKNHILMIKRNKVVYAKDIKRKA